MYHLQLYIWHESAMFGKVLWNWDVFHWSPGLNKQTKEYYVDNGGGNTWQLHVFSLKDKN